MAAARQAPCDETQRLASARVRVEIEKSMNRSSTQAAAIYARTAVVGVLAASFLIGSPSAARAQRSDRTDLLNASVSIEALVRHVSQSVVQVKVTGYRPVETDTMRASAAVGRGRSIASGVVVAADGYIVTNAHVVAGAERIEVVRRPRARGRRRLAAQRRASSTPGWSEWRTSSIWRCWRST
jgi:serine protease Do